MAKLGYARLSAGLQDPALQLDPLKAVGCIRTFVDKASGKLDRRPELARLFEVVLPGDVVVVWRLDRLGCSLKHLIETVTELGERGVGFRSLTEAIDTTTVGGKLLFRIMGALAEFERQLNVERTQVGLAAARARGHYGGRPPVMTAEKIRVAREMYDSREYTVETIASTLGVSRGTVYRHLDAALPAAELGDEQPRNETPAKTERRKRKVSGTTNAAVRESDVNDIAQAAGPTQEQRRNSRNVAASMAMAMEGMALTLEELSAAAEAAAGIDGAE